MSTLRTIFWRFSRSEKAFLLLSLLAALIAATGLIWNFYTENTTAAPAEGGRFTVGAVGVMDQNFLLNPLLLRGTKKANAIESDLSALIFAGLMKFDSATGEIVDQLATHTLSENKRVYTFTLKANLTWHDGTPLTADDVLFTYGLLQDPEFPNQFLKKAFAGVTIEKVDAQTVRFTIPSAYKFFLTNFTLGLLPQHLLRETSVANLQFDAFNLNPVGAGPYRLSGISTTENGAITTLTLDAFAGYALGKPKVSSIEFQLFPTDELLQKERSDFDLLRPKLKELYAEFADTGDFRFLDFTLPQYVAVFLNMDSPKLNGEANKKTRLALQLATDKTALLENIAAERIDTPLLETNTTEWFYEFSLEKARGALKDQGWLLGGAPVEPALPPVTETPPVIPTDLTYISEPSKKPVTWITTPSTFLLGSFPAGTTTVKVNGYILQLFNPERGRFSYKLDTALGTLKKGENTYTVEFFKGSEKIGTETAKINLVDSLEQIPSETAPVASAESTQTPMPVPEAAPNESQNTLPDGIRRNAAGAPLELNLVTVSTPEFYPQIADLLKTQWAEVGVALKVTVLEPDVFATEALTKKNYDLLLYSQNLGYALDAYPFWHFSQVGEGGSNLSQYRSFEAGVLLEQIRETHDTDLRNVRLNELKEIIKNDIPAIFLFSPIYTLPVSPQIENVNLAHIALLPDQFADVEQWYLRYSRDFQEGKNWLSFIPWFGRSLAHAFSF